MFKIYHNSGGVNNCLILDGNPWPVAKIEGLLLGVDLSAATTSTPWSGLNLTYVIISIVKGFKLLENVKYILYVTDIKRF